MSERFTHQSSERVTSEEQVAAPHLDPLLEAVLRTGS